MSSTLRGGIREVTDYYRTPINIIETFYSNFLPLAKFNSNLNILDPCCGGDSTMSGRYGVYLDTLIKNQYCPSIDSISTLDIRDDSFATEKINYLNFNTNNKYNLIISNPPFSLAEEFIIKSLDLLSEGGYLIFLLRLNFLESKKRFQLWKKYQPEYIFVNHQRISFTPDNKTDSIAYAHFVWRNGYNESYSKTFVV